MINNFLEARAEKLLIEAKCFSFPIKVELLSDHLKIRVEEVDLEPGVSGFLAINNDNAVIGYDRHQGKERKRFTIAHELSHFVLHARKELPLFIDKDQKPEQRIMFRDTASSTGEFIKEREANAFAAALLMPRKLVEQEVRTCNIDNIQEAIVELAKRFEVSTQAMSIRLANLDIIDYNAV